MSSTGRLPGTSVAALRRCRSLQRALAPYSFAPAATARRGLAEALRLAPSRFARRCADRLESLVGERWLGRRMASKLVRAGARARPGDALAAWSAAMAMIAAGAWAAAGTLGLGLVAVLGVAAPLAALDVAGDRRRQRFAAQLPGVLLAAAGGLRAGFSLLQSLSAVAHQVDEPAAGEVQRALNEVHLGRPIDQALEDAARRMGNADFAESVAAVRIQQETGGNLASLFDVLAETMLGRARLRREVRALTAEARLSAYVLGALPLVLGALISAVDHAYLRVLLDTSVGQLMLLGALILQLAGFLVLFRMSRVEP